MEQEQDLREMVQRSLRLAEENNRMLHAIRRNARMVAFGRLLYWIVVLVLLWLSYSYYVAPYLQKIEKAYESFQSSTAKAQTQADQAQQFLGNLQQSFQKYFPAQKQ